MQVSAYNRIRDNICCSVKTIIKSNNVRISCFLSFGVVLVMRSGVSFSFCVFSDDLAFLQRLPICIVIWILVFLGTTTTATNTGYCLLLAATSPSFHCTVNIFFNFILILLTLLVWPKSKCMKNL